MSKKFSASDYRIDGSEPLVLAERPNAVDRIYDDKSDYKKQIRDSRDAINELQRMMYAHDRYSLLCVFQAMDAAGKDGTIRNVI